MAGEAPSTWNGGTLSTAGGLVFQGAGDGYFSAYDAATGSRLLHLFTGTSMMAAPITYSLGGKQYVAVAAGYGGSGMLSIGDAAAVKNYENNGRLLVFTLGGGEVPLPRKREVPLGPPVVDNSGVPPMDPAGMARGKELYLQCAGCHGTAGSTAMLPNLGRVKTSAKRGSPRYCKAPWSRTVCPTSPDRLPVKTSTSSMTTCHADCTTSPRNTSGTSAVALFGLVAGSFLGAQGREHAAQAVVAFVASVFVDRPAALLPVDRCGPRPCPTVGSSTVNS